MESGVIIQLPGEPIGKGRPRFAVVRGKPRAFTPPQTRSYETALRWASQIAMKSRKPFEGALSVIVTAMMPIPKSWPKSKQEAALRQEIPATGKPDADNLLKTLDALNGIVFKDDSQIVSATIQKVFSDKPALMIMVTPHSV